MLRQFTAAIAVTSLVACGAGPEKKPGEDMTTQPVEAPTPPKEAMSKLLPWSVPEKGQGIEQDKREVTVTEEWLAGRLARPAHKLHKAAGHDRGVQVTRAPAAGALAGMGFKDNDVIVSVDGNQPTADNAIAHVLGGLIVDEEVDVRVQRKTKTGSWVEGTIEFKLKSPKGHGAGFIEQAGENTFRVNKNAAQLALATGGAYTPDTTRFVTEGGGVKLAAVGPKSLMRALGFNSGDTLTAIGGNPPGTPDASWAAGDKLEATVKRDGKDVKLTWILK